MSEHRVFQCAECGNTFEQENASLRCPQCGCKTLLLKEGPSLKGSHNCGGNCGSCSCGCHH